MRLAFSFVLATSRFAADWPEWRGAGRRGVRQLITWHPTAVSSLDPTTGQLLWELPWNVKTSALIVGTPVRQGNRFFLSCFYNGPS